MKKYQIFIDIPIDDDWEDIEVESIVVEAFNCNDAFMKATREAQELYEDFYVWEVTEDDILDDE